MTGPWLTVVGIGEDGYDGLAPAARAALANAVLVAGSARQLALVPPSTAERLVWPVPMVPALDAFLARERAANRPVVVLASGDPMLHGVGATLARRLAEGELRVLPQPSAFALACARLAWPAADVTLVSVVDRPIATVLKHLRPAARVVVYARDGETPAALAALLVAHGFGPSDLTAFERLGGPQERRTGARAEAWPITAECDALVLVAIACAAAPGVRVLATVPGLPDDAFETDGQLTKREVRAATLARLEPRPGDVLWDVGAGTGSIGIEWARAHEACRTVAFERDPERAARIARNATALGVPELRVVTGDAVAGVAAYAAPPDAIFIGGGLSAPGLLAACWAALRPGGRLVANVVTLEGETLVAAAHARYGGELARIAVSRAEPVGGMLGWRPLMAVTQWAAVKP